MKSLRPTENQICVAIARRLRVEKPKCFFTHVANEQIMSMIDRKAAARLGAHAKAMGKERGILDYLFLGMPAGFPIFWYEVKRYDCYPTKEQYQFMDYCARSGIPAKWSASDDWLHHYGIIRDVLVKMEALK